MHVFEQPLHLLAGECALCQIMYSLAGLFWRNDLGCASVIPSEQTASSYIILYITSEQKQTLSKKLFPASLITLHGHAPGTVMSTIPFCTACNRIGPMMSPYATKKKMTWNTPIAPPPPLEGFQPPVCGKLTDTWVKVGLVEQPNVSCQVAIFRYCLKNNMVGGSE